MSDLPARVGFIGAGWRANTYFTVIRGCPDRFELAGVLCRRESTARWVKQHWDVPATTSADELLAERLDFIVLCAPREAVSELLALATASGIPTLVETPLAVDVRGLGELFRKYGPSAPIQSAEQYRYQPGHAARIAVAHSGLLGEVRTAEVSVAHDYHAMSLIRTVLQTGYCSVRVRAKVFDDVAADTLGRGGWARDLTVRHSSRTRAELEFENGKIGLYDFTGEQYFSPIRSRLIAIRGDRGELRNDDVSFIAEPGKPVHQVLRRDQTGIDGDLSGYHLRGIALGDAPVYRNPLGQVRLSDDEIAVGTVLAEMARFAEIGDSFYGLAEACEDQYLAELVQLAARSGTIETSQSRIWAPQP